MYVCGTVECVIDMFLDGVDAILGGIRQTTVVSKDQELFASDRLVATRYDEYIVVHPVGFFPGSAIASIYGKVIGRAIGRTALVHTDIYSCVPRVRVYMAVGEVLDLSLTWPVFVYPKGRRVDGLELCPEMLEINHLLLLWAVGKIRASEAVSLVRRMGYSIGLLRGDFDGSAVLYHLNVSGSPIGSFYLCDPRGDVWVGVASSWVKYGSTSMTTGCVEVVRPFEGLEVPEDVEILLKRIRGDPSAVQLADDVIG